MVVKYGIANVTPNFLAKKGQAARLFGSITKGVGFGLWGIEPVSFLEIALTSEVTLERCDAFVLDILRSVNEQAAYRVVNGQDASILYFDGRQEVL